MRVETPNRREHTHVQRHAAPPERVFPLLCPVRECEWEPDWAPSLVVSASGVAEPGCLFVHRSGLPDAPDSIWTTIVHDPAAGRVRFLKIVPGIVATDVDLAVAGDGAGGALLTVTYRHTALGPRGDEIVAAFTEEAWRGFMAEWEANLGHYLATGRLRAA